jgi:hypothetical protein
MKRLFTVFGLVAWIAMVPSVGHAVTELSGFSAGAFFRILVPDGIDPPVPWNGDLVIWNHGFSFTPIGPVTDMGPLADLQIAQGYAVAASSYQQSGWAVFKTNNDLREMIDVFKANFGSPDEIILTGGSLGGIVTAAAIETGNLGNVVGAMPICGALAGSRNWDGGTDIRLIYDVYCTNNPFVGNLMAIPGGAAGLPEGVQIAVLPPDEPNLATLTTLCFGTPFPSPLPFANARRIQWEFVTGLPASFLLTTMAFATNGLADLVWDPAKLDGKIGVTTEGVEYDPIINDKIARVSPNPGAAVRLGKRYTPTGRVGDTKIVSLHTDKDGLVIVENEKEYDDVVPDENLTIGVVVEDFPSHCGFTDAEVVAAWESLRGWIGGQPQPSAAVLQGTCQFIEASGLADGPCRIDPTFVIPDMDGRIPPR